MIRAALLLCVAMVPAQAEMLTSTRIIPARSVLTDADLVAADGNTPGSTTDRAELVGKEALVALYPGRAILLSDVGPPAMIERNEPVPLIYSVAGLSISTEGRALDRAAAGEWIRVINMQSRNTVSAYLAEDGRAYVKP